MSKELKEQLIALLVAAGVIPGNFTGKLTLNVNSGALCDAERIERLK